MKRQIRISAVQLPMVIPGRTFAEKQAANRRVIRSMLRTAGERKSDLTLLGEYSNLHHRTWSSNRREYVADPIPGPFVRMVSALARRYRMNVALPVFGRFRGVLSNYVVLLDRGGKIIGCYQKTHPTLAEQEIGMVPGDDLPVFTFDCVKVGIMTCMDVEYPEVAQVLMLKGAELLLFPHVQGTWGEIDWEIRYRARAIDTGLNVVSACYGLPEGGWKPGKIIGRTSIIGRDGLVVADLGRAIGVLTADLDLSTKRTTEFYFRSPLDRTLAVTASRRPDLYTILVNRTVQRRALDAVKRLPRKKK